MERLSLEGHAQSSFHYSIRRTQCDQQPMIRRNRLDFVSTGSDTKVLICLVLIRTLLRSVSPASVILQPLSSLFKLTEDLFVKQFQFD